METNPPKPAITYFGDEAVLSTVLQKKLQARIRQSQVHSLSKEDPPYSSFNAFCEGVEFLHFPAAKERLKGDYPIYQRPALHTFWCSSYDANHYRSHDRPLIKQWLDDISGLGSGHGGHAPAMSLIIYCVTAEVRARKQRPLLANTSIEERLRTDYKNMADEIIVFRLASSEESRLVESSQCLVAKLTSMALAKFNKDIDKEKETMARLQKSRCEPDHFYSERFIRKLDLAVACEMTVQSELALKLYSEAASSLEEALTQFSDAATPPKWLESMCHAPCTTWDYPKLAWTQLSWRYLSDVRSCSSPLLHTRTFLLVRVAHLLFLLDRAWSVTEKVINALHSMAREIKLLKLSFPAGAFDCWAYMSCKEAIQAFMARISPDSLMAATSSLLLVRAELWHYSLQKLHDVGVLCGLMPSSNKLNFDNVLIQQISSGITPVPSHIRESYDLVGVEDLGSELQNMLNVRKDFQREFLSLGEMVIGAFKHAGRRRMAFRVGTMIAQFHRDMGLMVEAEELLSDICKFYSEDQWLELSTKAYSLLADCQMKLRLEEKHINTMLLLASFPPYPAASHDPVPWMDRVLKIAQHSPYQKLLSWEPLLELVRLEGGGGGKKGVYIGDQVHLDLVINLHAPEGLKNLIVTVQTKLADSPVSPTLGSAPSSGMHTPHRSHLGASPALSYNSLANLDDLDLESESCLPHSRPIGESSKFRSMTHVTHISHADITEMGALWKADEEISLLSLVAVGIALTPGQNKFRVQGKGIKDGEYLPHKISVKLGALDFAYTVPSSKAARHSFTVLEHQVNVEVKLASQDGVFLAGCPQNCTLSFSTSGNTSIPAQAPVHIAASSSDVLITLQSSEPPLPGEDGEEKSDCKSLQLSLPGVEPGEACQLGVVMRVPAVNSVQEALCSSEETNSLVGWKHKVEVYCDWMSPPHAATLPLLVYEPLGLSCVEHCAGGQSFLQLILANTCPVPLLVRHPSFTTNQLDLDSLHSNLPEVFSPEDTYSFLWQRKTTSRYLDKIPDRTEGSFEVEFSPLPADFDQSHCPLPNDPKYSVLHYDLKLSNMQTIFEVQLNVEASVDNASIVINQPATLICTVTNKTAPPPQETRFGFTPPSLEDSMASSSPSSQKVGYEVHVNRKFWNIQGKGRGAFDMPAPLKQTRLQFQLVPVQGGVLQLPTVELYSMEGGESGKGGDCSRRTPLTNAQVYHSSRGQLVTVHSDDTTQR